MPSINVEKSNPDAIYPAEVVMNLVGLKKNEYSYRRGLIDKKRQKHQKFSEADIWVYMMVSRYLRARITASELSEANWPLIFEACNSVEPDTLRQWKFVYIDAEGIISIIVPGDRAPKGEEFYDKVTVRMSDVMNRTDVAFAESRRIKGKKKTGDEFMLARLKRDLAKVNN